MKIDYSIPTALLVIDTQKCMFAEGNAVYQSEEIIKKIKNVISFAKSKKLVLAYFQHDGGEGSPEEHGTEGWKILPELETEAPVFEKNTIDGFESTDIKSFLDKNKIGQLIVCGMQSEFCVETNSKRAAALGYKVYLLEDAHSTFSFDKPALEIIKEVNLEVQKVAQLLTVDQLLSQT